MTRVSHFFTCCPKYICVCVGREHVLVAKCKHDAFQVFLFWCPLKIAVLILDCEHEKSRFPGARIKALIKALILLEICRPIQPLLSYIFTIVYYCYCNGLIYWLLLILSSLKKFILPWILRNDLLIVKITPAQSSVNLLSTFTCLKMKRRYVWNTVVFFWHTSWR